MRYRRWDVLKKDAVSLAKQKYLKKVEARISFKNVS